MNKLKKKVLKYLSNNKGKKIFIDTKIEISSDQIVTLANNINQKKIVNKKIIINIERSADYIGLIWALWINGNTVIPTNKNWPKRYINEIFRCKNRLCIQKSLR